MKRYHFNAVKLAKDLIREPYAWPGGYEKFAVMNDGGVICYSCCKKEYRQICHDSLKGWHTGWDIGGIDCTVNCDMESLHCDHCNRTIYEYEE